VSLPTVKTSLITGKDHCIFLGTINDQSARDVMMRENIDDKELAKPQSYVLNVSPNQVVIIGGDSAGLFYGVETFLQLVAEKGQALTIPGVAIVDYPAIALRAVHLFNTDLDKIKEQLERMARCKLNAAMIDNWILFNLDQEKNRLKIADIDKFAREHCIQLIPELQSFGAAGGPLSKDPECVEGAWVENEPFKFVDDIAQPMKQGIQSLQNVLRTENTDVMIKNATGKIYKEGKDYIVKTTGKIEIPFLQRVPSRIIRVPGGEINNGDEVLVSYDQVLWMRSFGEWKIPYCPSEPRTYKVMFSALEEIIKIIKPAYISIGHDEIRGMNRDSRCRRRGMTNAELLAEDITRLNNFVKSIAPETTVLVWDDMLNPWHNGNNENYQIEYGGLPGKTAPAIDSIPRDVAMVIWWTEPEDWLSKMRHSLDYFEQKGFRYCVSCYKNKKNIDDWVDRISGRSHCFGIMTTTWEGFDNNIEGIMYLAEKSWKGNNLK
jgi:hypothetical protein